MAFPSFNYALMEILCKELQDRILHFKVIDCFPHDLHRFSFILREKDRKEVLFFCFSPPFIRFHLLETPSVTQSTSSHPLLSFLKEATLKHVELLQHDRILQLTFSTSQGERRFIAEFFPKHPNYYLVQSDGKILFALHPISKTHYQLPPQHSFIQTPATWHSHQELEYAYAKLEKDWEVNKEKQALHTLFSKRIKNLQKKQKKLENDLKQYSEWEKIQHEGDLIKFYLGSIKKGIPSLEVHDWMTDQLYHLELDPSKTPQEAMALRYKRAKKMQLGQMPLAQHLEKVRGEIAFFEQQKQKLENLVAIEEVLAFKQSFPLSLQPQQSLLPKNKPAPIYREYQSTTGMKIWVGKNAKANDRLTFQLANGRDWWLHVRGYSGSHVIIRLERNEEPDSETLQDALQLALYHSKARSQGEAEVCFTQRKFVSRLGKPGLVQISKHQTAWVHLDSSRLKKLSLF